MSKLKLCGLIRPRDIEIANELHADYVGFVFAPSARRITFEHARYLKSLLDPTIPAVGIFVDEEVDTVIDALNTGVIDVAQLHGDEDEGYIGRVQSTTRKPVIKAIKTTDPEQVRNALNSKANFLLFDGKRGGSGQAFDWSLLEGVNRPFFLAGGINESNIDEALSHEPYAIDVSSGIETSGFKDKDKIIKLIERVRLSTPQNADSADGDTTSAKIQPLSGRYGVHGGQYVPETLMGALTELSEAYEHYRNDASFVAELADLLNHYAGRPSRLYFAERMTKDLGGAKIYLKREDLNHTGSHKINNVLGQVLLAKKMGKTRVIAETGAGQHGVATATAAALMGLECEIFMGKEDTERQALNVYRMKLLGAQVHEVTSGTATLKDAVSETMREWTRRIDDTHYVLGSVMGPHPFPQMVRDFQAVISQEIKAELALREGRLPDAVIACVGGGSNAIGAFYHFIDDAEVALIGCEAAGRGVDTADTAATLATGSLGIFHGMKSYFCQDSYGQIAPVYSISAGLDYPGVGPEHAFLFDCQRAQYVPVTDDEAVAAFEYLSQTEGIIPAIESAHAVSYALKLAPTMRPDQIVVINLSGRGDKDCAAIARYRGEDINE